MQQAGKGILQCCLDSDILGIHKAETVLCVDIAFIGGLSV